MSSNPTTESRPKLKWSDRCSLWLRICFALFGAVIGYTPVYLGAAWIAFLTVPVGVIVGLYYPELRDDAAPTWVRLLERLLSG